MSKTKSYKANIKKLREHIDLYIKNLHWARNEENYAYMIGLVSAYNRCVEGLDDTITEIPDTPDMWLEDINEKIKRQQDADSKKIVMPEKPKIILP